MLTECTPLQVRLNRLAANQFSSAHPTSGKAAGALLGNAATGHGTNPIVVPARIFEGMLRSVMGSASHCREGLKGISIGFSNGLLAAAATDSYRAAISECNLDPAPARFSAIVDGRDVRRIVDLIGSEAGGDEAPVSAELVIDGRMMRVRCKGEEVLVPLLPDRFPNIGKLLCAKPKSVCVVDKAVLAGAIDHAPCGDGSGAAVVHLGLQPSEQLLTIAGHECGESIRSVISGWDVTVLLNKRYLLDGLEAMLGDQVVVSAAGEDEPILLESLGEVRCRYLLMPIKR